MVVWPLYSLSHETVDVALYHECSLLTEIKVGGIFRASSHMADFSCFCRGDAGVSQLSYWHWSESCNDARTVRTPLCSNAWMFTWIAQPDNKAVFLFILITVVCCVDTLCNRGWAACLYMWFTFTCHASFWSPLLVTYHIQAYTYSCVGTWVVSVF